MTFLSVFPDRHRHRHPPPADPRYHSRRRLPAWAHRRGEHGRDPVATLTAYLHAFMPAIVVVAELLLQALHNAIPLMTLLALVSAAYGRLLWVDFLEYARLRLCGVEGDVSSTAAKPPASNTSEVKR